MTKKQRLTDFFTIHRSSKKIKHLETLVSDRERTRGWMDLGFKILIMCSFLVTLELLLIGYSKVDIDKDFLIMSGWMLLATVCLTGVIVYMDGRDE